MDQIIDPDTIPSDSPIPTFIIHAQSTPTLLHPPVNDSNEPRLSEHELTSAITLCGNSASVSLDSTVPTCNNDEEDCLGSLHSLQNTNSNSNNSTNGTVRSSNSSNNYTTEDGTKLERKKSWYKRLVSSRKLSSSNSLNAETDEQSSSKRKLTVGSSRTRSLTASCDGYDDLNENGSSKEIASSHSQMHLDVASPSTKSHSRAYSAPSNSDESLTPPAPPVLQPNFFGFKDAWCKGLDEAVLAGLSPLEKKRQTAIYELLVTERDYVKDLEVIVTVFLHPVMERKIVSVKNVDPLFSNVEQILCVHKELLAELEKRREESQVVMEIGDIFKKCSDYFMVYNTYCTNHSQSLLKLHSLLQSNRNFKNFLEETCKLPVCRGLALNSFLIKPVQRICKYPLLLKEILKTTDEKHMDATVLKSALEKLEIVLTLVNESARQAEGIRKMMELQSSFVDKNFHIVTPMRHVVREDDMNAMFNGVKKLRRVVLFNDMVLIARRDWRDKFRLVEKAFLTNVRVYDVKDSDESNEDLHLFELDVENGGNYILAANTKGIKTTWIDAFKKLTKAKVTNKTYQDSAALSSMEDLNKTEADEETLETEVDDGGSSAMVTSRNTLRGEPATDNAEQADRIIDIESHESTDEELAKQLAESQLLHQRVQQNLEERLLVETERANRLSKELEVAKKEVTDAFDLIRKHEDIVKQLELKRDEQAAKLVELSSALQEKEKQLDDKADVESMLAEQTEKCAQLDKELEQSRMELSEMRAKFSEMKNEQDAKIANLELSLQSALSKISEMEEENRNLQNLADNHDVAFKELESRYTQVLELNKSLESKVSAPSTRPDDESNSSQRQVIAYIAKLNAAFEKEAGNTVKRFADSRAEIVDVKTKLEEFEKRQVQELGKLQAVFVKGTESIRHHVAQETKTFCEKVEQLQSEYLQSRQQPIPENVDKVEAIQFDHEKEQLKSTVAILEGQAKESANRIQRLTTIEKKYRKLQTDFNKLVSVSKNREQSFKAYEKESTDKLRELFTYRLVIAEIAQLLSIELKQDAGLDDASLVNITAKIGATQMEVDHLKSALEAQKSAVNEKATENAALKHEVDGLLKQLSSRESTATEKIAMVALEQPKAAVNESSEEKQAEMSQKLEDMKKQLAHLESMNRELAARNGQLLSSQNTQKHTHEQELTTWRRRNEESVIEKTKLETQIESFKDKAVTLEKANERLERDAYYHEEAKLKAQGLLETSNENSKALATEAEKLRNDNVQLKKKELESRYRATELESKLEAALRDLKASAQKNHERACESIRLKEEITKRDLALGNLRGWYDRKIEELTKEIQVAGEAKDTSDRERIMLEAQNVRLQKMVAILETKSKISQLLKVANNM